MRTGSIVINKVEYPLCYSTRVLRACAERYGTTAGVVKALTEKDQVTNFNETIWLLNLFMDAGRRYQLLEGISDTPEVPSTDMLLDMTGIDDLGTIRSQLMATMLAGTETSIEVEKGKNAETTQAEE